MPIALIESQLAGIAVIATHVGSVSEVVINNETGIICHKTDDQLIAAVKKLAGDKKLRVKYGSAGRSNSVKLFSIKNFTNAHQKIYLQGR